MNKLHVIKPGFLSLLQDGGRFGHHTIGLTNGGPLDPDAFRWANRLCENPDNCTTIEITFGGLQLIASGDMRIAVTGAAMPLTINGEAHPLWQSHFIRSGDRIELGFCQQGCRSYLAVEGGLDITKEFGSTATVVREGLGGLQGLALQKDDRLPCATGPKHTQRPTLRVPEKFRPVYSNHAELRVIPGFQESSFSRYQQRLFLNSRYTVSDQCDRMGYRLSGPAIESSISTMLSEGICLGAIQIPGDGQPIILLNDRQTIGGYPKIGSVLSLDLSKLAQLQPGADISFTPISMDHAHNQLHLQHTRWQQMQPEEL